MTDFVRIVARSLPVLRSADILVVSGSFAGIAAAVECALAGRRRVKDAAGWSTWLESAGARAS